MITLSSELCSSWLPVRPDNGHKGTFGKVLVIGGSVGFTGAPWLAATAAVHSGCGLVYLGVPEAIWPVEAVKCTDSMPFPLADHDGKLSFAAKAAILQKAKDCDAVAIGPGLGRNAEVTMLVHRLLAEIKKPIVLDADGINALEGSTELLKKRKGQSTVLTPHDGEFMRIAPSLRGQDRLACSDAFAQDNGVILIRKGPGTTIHTPDGTVYQNTTGHTGLSRGGSGDILTGLIVSFLAQGIEPSQAAALAVWVHGRAGDLAEEALTPRAMGMEAVLAQLPAVFRELEAAH